jgi:hypothetical protein
VIPSDAVGVFQLTVAPPSLYIETIPTGASYAPIGAELGSVVGSADSEAAGVGVTVAVSEDEFFEITATAKIKIPTTTAITMPLDEEESLLAVDLGL